MGEQQLQARLDFQTQFNQIINQIHAAGSLNDLLVNLTERIADLLGCERLTIYAIDPKSNQLFSVRTNIQPPKVIRVAKDNNSIAGF